MGWWQDLNQTPGIGAIFGNLGSQFLAAPDLQSAFAAVGQVPGQLQQFRAAQELQEAERKRRELEDQLLQLRLDRAELENKALPLAQEQEARQRKLNLAATALGLQGALAGQKDQEAAAQERAAAAAGRKTFAENIPSPGLSALVASDPVLARSLAGAQAESMMAPTEAQAAQTELIRAQIEATRNAERRLDADRAKLEEQTRLAELRLRQQSAQGQAEEWRKHLESIDKQLANLGDLTPNADLKAELVKRRAVAMDRFTEAQNTLQSLSRQSGERTPPPTDGEKIMAKLTAVMEPEKAVAALRQVAAAGKQEEFDRLVAQGVHPAQAIRMVLAAQGGDQPSIQFPGQPPPFQGWGG